MISLISVPISAIASLTAEKAVGLIASIMHAEVAYAKLSPTVITISSRLTLPDGGIDAQVEVPPETKMPTDCFLVSGLAGYQIKSGQAFKPWTESSIRAELLNSKGKLFPEVERLTSKRGRYILICAGYDLTPQQKNDAIERIASTLACAGVSDYFGLIDVIGASQIVAFAERYPSIAAGLTSEVFQEAWTIDEWSRDEHMSTAFKPAHDQNELIAQIQTGIESDVKHIRLLGEPGLGKTRIVLEALRASQIAPLVLYLCHGSKLGQSALFRHILQRGWTKPLVLVLDDLSESEMSDVWRHLKIRCGAMKLITIDHGRDEGHDTEILRLEAPRLPDETIRCILADRIGDSHELDRWVSICEGSPRVAHAVAENLYANPADLLKPPSTVPLWTRFLHGYGVQDEAASRQVDCVAHHLALFSRFGFEYPVSDEAIYISKLITKVDPTVGWARFQEIVQDFRGRRVLQGSRTLFFVPKALHIYLWKQFWSRYGRGFDFASIFEAMPQSLHAWFLNKFRFADEKDAAFVVDEILKTDGIFSSRTMLTSAIGSGFLSTLAEANPAAVLRLLENTVGRWSDIDILGFKSHRQNIVWALEKIAVWPRFINRVCSVLTRLAVNENANYVNNATGTLVGLFRIGPEAVATEASPQQRLPALVFLLRSEVDAERILGLKALVTALDTRGMSFRYVGPEYQGLHKRARLWVPENYDDWWSAYLLYFRTLVEETALWPLALRPQVCLALLEAIEMQIKISPCADLAFQMLEMLVIDDSMDASKLNRFFRSWKECHSDESNYDLTMRINRLAESYVRRNLAHRVQRYVLDAEFIEWNDDFRRQAGKPSSHAKALVRALARRILKNPDKFDEISHLLSPREYTPAIWYFGEQLAAGDQDQQFLPWLTRLALKSSESTCLQGYLAGLKERSSGRLELWLLEMLRSADTASLGVEMTLRYSCSEVAFNRSLEALVAAWVAPECFRFFRFGIFEGAVPLMMAEKLLFQLYHNATPEAMRVLIALLATLESDQPMVGGVDFVFSVVQKTIPDSRSAGNSFGFQWQQVCSRLVNLNKSLAAPLLDAILDVMSRKYEISYDSGVEKISKMLVRVDPEGSWQVIAKHFEETLPEWRSDLYFWLKGGIQSFDEDARRGPIAYLPEAEILRWIEIDSEKRAPLIAHAAVPSLDDEKGGGLTRKLLDLYGHFDGVRSGVSASFHSGSWRGLASLHFKRKRETLRRWLSAGFGLQINQWIEREIEYIDSEIQREEIVEERDRFE